MSTSYKLGASFLRSGKHTVMLTEYIPLGNSIQKHLLLICPFAEEMNKSRHIYSLLARQLCLSGIACYLLDYRGTGDSSGDFGEATIDKWLEDLGQK